MSYADAIACMGGNCTQRDRCARYHAPAPARDNPFERLCSQRSYLMFLAIPPKATAGTFRPFAGANETRQEAA